MGYVNCKICGERMLGRVGKNSVIVDGEFKHKKCPQKAIKEEDLAIYKRLKDTIVEAFLEYGSPEAKMRGLNWFYINSQINGLVKQGYTYDDIIYSFEKCIERDRVYWGFGRVLKFIATDIATKNKMEQFKSMPKPKENVKFEFKGSEIDW